MNKFSRTLTLSIFLTAASTAHAELYIGGNVGGNMATIKKNISYPNGSSSLSSAQSGFRGQALIGYNFHFIASKEIVGTGSPSYRSASEYSDRVEVVNGDIQERVVYGDTFFIAIEFDGAYNSGEAKQSINPWFLTTSASVQEQQRYTFDLFALAKYRLQPSVILFAGPGVSRGQFNVSTSSQTAGFLGISGDNTTWQNGWSVKAGIEAPIMTAVNLVATYQYTDFQNAKWTHTEPLTGQSVTVNYSPRISSVTLGLNWAFL